MPPCGRLFRHFPPAPCAKRLPAGARQPSPTQCSDARTDRRSCKGEAQAAPIDLTREVLEVPADYRIGIVTGVRYAAPDGAVVAAGARPVTMLAWESFGEGWVS
jgi:phosphoserine aminotransferase